MHADRETPPPGARHSISSPAAGTPAVSPRDLKVKLAEQKLSIEWKDGTRSEFDLGRLRKVCPCATCRAERERAGANPLRILSSDPSTLRVVSAKLVGNYALQLDWSDGHDTGIFDFRFLRSLG